MRKQETYKKNKQKMFSNILQEKNKNENNRVLSLALQKMLN